MLKGKEFLNAINSASIAKMSKEEVKENFGDKIAAMIGVEQNNPHHVYDVWFHTLAALSAMEDSNLAKVMYGNECKLAAFLHDVGKPETKGINPKTGYDTFYGHEKVSARIAKEIIEEAELTDLINVDFVLKMIKNHGITMNLTVDKENKNIYKTIISPESIIKLMEKLDYDLNDMVFQMEICKADIMAQSPIVVTKDGTVLDSMSAKLTIAEEVCKVCDAIYEAATQSEEINLNKEEK